MDKLVLNRAGVRELLRSAEMQAACKEVAQTMAAGDSGKSSINTHVGRNRCNAEIVLTGRHSSERRDRMV